MGQRNLVALAALSLACGACDSWDAGSGSSAPKVAESGTKRGSASGFSATLAAELVRQDPALAQTTPPPAPRAGSASAAPAGSAAAKPATVASQTAAPTPAPTAATTPPAPASGSVASPAPVVATTPAPASGSAASPAPVVATTPAPAATNTEVPAEAIAAAPKIASRALMKPPAEIAAIKLELEPNWDRDLGEAGTFSLVVKVPNTDTTRVFSFHYGYEDDTAPVDCDLYKKFLEDKKVGSVTLNRQRGAACYIEADEAGAKAFRYLVTYGGKRLLCRGSLYKDAASSALGDLRDKVLMQAKKICETLSL
jgi:hypothetical protein